MLWFFKEEKNFSQDLMVNSQENHWFALSSQDVPTVMKNIHPIHTMVFRVPTRNDDDISLFIFPHCLRLSKEFCIKCLEEVVLPWIERGPYRGIYTWQQDSTPCHTSRRTQSCLQENFCNLIITPNIWLPSSSDCNGLDYYV